MSDDTEQLSAADVLSFLGDEHRLAILRNLYDDSVEPGPDLHTATYSELQEATGIEDSGRFNYHLTRLTGHFVEKSEGEYRLREPGKEVVRTLRRGRIAEVVEFDPVPTDATCFRCGATVEVSYTGSFVVARCTDCPGFVHMTSVPAGTISGTLFPPAGAEERDPTELLVYAHDRFEQWVGMMADGFCPECGGSTTATLDACANHDVHDPIACDDSRLASGCELELACRNCGRSRLTHPLLPFARHPTVASEFLATGAENGWERFGAACDWTHEVVDDERVRFTSPSGDVAVVVEGADLVAVADATDSGAASDATDSGAASDATDPGAASECDGFGAASDR